MSPKNLPPRRLSELPAPFRQIIRGEFLKLSAERCTLEELRDRAVDILCQALRGHPAYAEILAEGEDGPPAMDARRSLPDPGEYFFWNGESKLSTAIGNARKPISRVLTGAGIKGHPHRFRDTFSVSPLSKGEELRTVQLLLGHKSIRTTEKHYAPFVESFQRVLDAATAKLDFGTRRGTRKIKGAKLLKMHA